MRNIVVRTFAAPADRERAQPPFSGSASANRGEVLRDEFSGDASRDFESPNQWRASETNHSSTFFKVDVRGVQQQPTCLLPEPLMLMAAVSRRPASRSSVAQWLLPIADRLFSGGSPNARITKLTANATRSALSAGIIPSCLQNQVRACLVIADRAYSAGDLKQARNWLTRAAALLFHTTLHFSQVESLLIRDPEAFLTHWRNSIAAQSLSPADNRSERVKIQPTRDIDFITFKNSKFLPLIIDRFAESENHHARLIDLGASEFASLPLFLKDQIGLALGVTGLPTSIVEVFNPDHTQFIEWGQRAASLGSRAPNTVGKRIVRVHAYEACTAFLQIIDPNTIDCLIFVSPHMKKLVHAVAPHLQDVPHAVIPNAMNLNRFSSVKSEGAERTITILGYGSPQKDPMWALEVLDCILERDSNWTMQFIGEHFPRKDRPGDVAYARRFDEARARFGDQVQLLPFQNDVSLTLQSTGYLLSSSSHESFHLAIAEGAASAAVPVVRRWPGYSRWGGPHEIFPEDWIVDSPEQAAARILETSARREDHGAQARGWVLDHLDWSVVKHRFDSVLWEE